MKGATPEWIPLRWRLTFLVAVGLTLIGSVLYVFVWLPTRMRCWERPAIVTVEGNNSSTYEMASFVVTAPTTWQGWVSRNQVGEGAQCEQRLSFAPPWGDVVFRCYHDRRPNALEEWANAFPLSSQQAITINGYPAIKKVGRMSEMYFIRWDARILVVSVEFRARNTEAQTELERALNSLQLLREHDDNMGN